MENLRGSYDDSACRSQQVRIGPRSRGFTDNSDWHQWDRRQRETKREPDRHGLEVFSYTPANESDRALAAMYFIGRSAAGEMTRFVRCSDVACRHEALIGDYRLLYTTGMAELVSWEETDRKLAALVDSWRAP
jgi:hypothetical protein